MSRSHHRDDERDYVQDHPQTEATQGSSGRGGGGSANEKIGEGLVGRSRTNGKGDAASNLRQLAAAIDSALHDKPTMTEFVQRLQHRGIQPIPSIQSTGRLNGFSFRFAGKTYKGSDLGRAYTAQGLQQKRGLQYEPSRDREALIQALDRAGLHSRGDRDLTGQALERSTRSRGRDTELSPDQLVTLKEVGRFRTVSADDVLKDKYKGDQRRLDRDLRVLQERGMIQRRTLTDPKNRTTRVVLVLTNKGRSHARQSDHSRGRENEPQRYYSGFVKPAEVKHDAAIYRMYQAERDRIESAGGSIKRVVLDYELKQKVFSKLNQPGNEAALDHTDRKHRIADENGLAVVQSKIVFPDLRIEYETQDQELDKVDLELASDQYKDSEVAQKRAAGLRIYGPKDTPRCAALHDPEIVAGLISL